MKFFLFFLFCRVRVGGYKKVSFTFKKQVMKTFETWRAQNLKSALQEWVFENPMLYRKKDSQTLAQTREYHRVSSNRTGKTAAWCSSNQKTDINKLVPQTLILSPTRELCYKMQEIWPIIQRM